MQLELFRDEPFCLRLKIENAVHIFWEHYWQFLPTAQTTKAHKRRILQYFSGRFVDTISKADIEDFRRWLTTDEGLDIQTANKAHMLLSRIFTKLTEYRDGKMAHGVDYSKLQIPDRNPCAMVKRPRARKRAQVATVQEIQRIRYYADDDLTDIINMLLLTRLRPGDLKRLSSLDVDLQRKKIELVQHKTICNKNPSGIQIVIPISEKMADILIPRLARTKPGSPLFPFRNMQKRWESVREKAGAKHIQLRDLRRTAASFLLDSGEDPLTVAQGLGHVDLKMLPTYTPRTIQHQKQSLDKLEREYV